jgi:murein DD-endopeptidase MepM/ murein hydrolase activator NlpD
MEKSTIYNQTTESQNTVLQTENLKPGSIVCELEGRGTLTITLTPDGKLTGEHQTPNKTFLLSEMEVLNLVNQENIPLQESWPVLEANNNLSKYSDSEIRDRHTQAPLQSADELMLIELHKEIEEARAKLDKITTQITQVKTTGGSPTVLQNPETIIQNQQPVTPESIQYGAMLKMVELLQNKEKQEDLKFKLIILGCLVVLVYAMVDSCSKKMPVKVGEFVSPVKGRVSSTFGPRKNPATGIWQKAHGALDVAVPFGTRINAPAEGVLEYLPHNRSCGRGAFFKVTKPNNDFKSRDFSNIRFGLCHLKGYAVPNGTKVKKGDKIAFVGGDKTQDPWGSGSSTGPHLHIKESRKINGNWTSVDPLLNSMAKNNEKRSFKGKKVTYLK